MARRSVLVTGGTRGIGEAIVRTLALRDVNVGCGYAQSQERAEELAREHPERVLPVTYRLGEARTADSAVEAIVSTFGGLDGLVLNAGVWAGGRLGKLDPAEWERVVAANLFGAAQLCRSAVPVLARADAASITIVSSVVGLIGGPGDTAYASAKAGLIGFAKSLAKEVAGQGIRVNVVAPGFVETEMTAGVPEQSKDHIRQSILLKRAGSAAEIADAVVFLSEDATYCTGSVLTVDGGWSM
jgi:3-oxoacyl-[acyl-carrier protein] reductase